MMRVELAFAIACVGSAFVARGSSAQEIASFDCSVAEKGFLEAICEDEEFVFMAREIEGQYRSLRETRPELVADHAAWSNQLKRCADDLFCIGSELSQRWVALGRRTENALGRFPVSGVYDYVSRPNDVSGELTLAAGAGESYGFAIFTVTLEFGHMCSVLASNAQRTQVGLITWQDGTSGNTLSISAKEDGSLAVEIGYDSERQYCGARATVAGQYRLLPAAED